MQPGTLIGIIILGAVFVAFIIWLGKNRSRAYHRAFEEIATSLGGTYKSGEWPFEGTISGKTGTREYQIELSQGDKVKGKLILFKLKIPDVAFEGEFEMKKKGIISRAKGATKAGEFLHTGNADFDSRIAVRGEPESKLMNFIMNMEFQNAALNLAKRDFTLKTKEGILVAAKTYAEKPDRNIDTLKNDIHSMITIADCLGK